MGPEESRPPRKPVALDVLVPTDDRSYPVLVGPGLLSRVGRELRRSVSGAKRVAIVSDDTVMPLHGEAVRDALTEEEFEVVEFTVPAGEASKTPDKLLELVNGMVDAGLTRRDAVVALGGGVVGDLAGCAAATFMRGIAYLQCPTSLLAQVDSSVGGKVAVDLPRGKNLFGAFHFPVAVIADTSVLSTLPERQIACGLAEMIKHGALFSAEHFNGLVDHADGVFEGDAEVVQRLIAHSVALKASSVSRDPHELAEAGKGRILLNLGHTVGHAIERISDYELLHGEAVALGLIAMARISEAKGIVEESPEGGLEAYLCAALERLRLPTDLDTWLVDERAPALEAALGADKKRGFGTLTYIALRRIGDATVMQLTPDEIVALLRP